MNDKFQAQRTPVIGPSGAGKSSVSATLGKSLRIDLIYLDRHFYQPGWKSLPPDLWQDCELYAASGFIFLGLRI
jgi:adenylate kinase family enzyme